MSTRHRWLIDAYDIEAQRRWSDRTFGTGARTKGVLAHIRKELKEVEAKPDDLSEWADLLILVIDGATRRGFTAGGLIAAYHDKIRENRHREWPPIPEGGFPEDEAIEHVREPAATGQRVHMVNPASGRIYCGAKPHVTFEGYGLYVANDPSHVTCSDCHAAAELPRAGVQ